MIKTDKPWGYEELLENNDFYVVKRLFMKEGCRCSLQYHEYKCETIYVLSGILNVTIDDDKYLRNVILNENEYIHINNNVIHRMEAVKDCLYLESSTNQLNDVVRISDDYSRV